MPKTTSPKLLRFTVWEKKKGCLIHVGDAKFHVVLRGTKHNIKSLRAPIVYKQKRHSFYTPPPPGDSFQASSCKDTSSSSSSSSSSIQTRPPGSDQPLQNVNHDDSHKPSLLQGMQ